MHNLTTKLDIIRKLGKSDVLDDKVLAASLIDQEMVDHAKCFITRAEHVDIPLVILKVILDREGWMKLNTKGAEIFLTEIRKYQ